jgi:hypothetical protein
VVNAAFVGRYLIITASIVGTGSSVQASEFRFVEDDAPSQSVMDTQVDGGALIAPPNARNRSSVLSHDRNATRIQLAVKYQVSPPGSLTKIQRTEWQLGFLVWAGYSCGYNQKAGDVSGMMRRSPYFRKAQTKMQSYDAPGSCSKVSETLDRVLEDKEQWRQYLDATYPEPSRKPSSDCLDPYASSEPLVVQEQNCSHVSNPEISRKPSSDCFDPDVPRDARDGPRGPRCSQ